MQARRFIHEDRYRDPVKLTSKRVIGHQIVIKLETFTWVEIKALFQPFVTDTSMYTICDRGLDLEGP